MNIAVARDVKNQANQPKHAYTTTQWVRRPKLGMCLHTYPYFVFVCSEGHWPETSKRFLLLWYSVLFTVKSLSLLYLLVISKEMMH